MTRSLRSARGPICLVLVFAAGMLAVYPGASPESSPTGESRVITVSFDSHGGMVDLHDPIPELRWFRLVVEPGAVNGETEISVALAAGPEKPPPGFVAVSPLIALLPAGLATAEDIIVSLPYSDEDDDGIIDGTLISEAEILPAYYSRENRCWGPLEPMVPDHAANMIGFKTNHLDPVALFAPERADASRSGGGGIHVTWLDWADEPELSEEDVVDRCKRHLIDTIFIHVYSPDEERAGEGILECRFDGHAPPEGVTASRRSYSLRILIAAARREGIRVVANLSCFSHTHPDVEEHRVHLIGVVEYLLRHYPGLDGVMLDYIRYSEYSAAAVPSPDHIEAVTTFVDELGRAIGAAVPVYLNLFTHADTRRELLLGQRYADLSTVSDVFCPMIYASGEKAEETIERLTRRAALCRTEENALRIVPLLRTWDPMTAEQLSRLISAAIRAGADDVGFFRLSPTDRGEWQAIRETAR